jgi:hypothetical protein
MGHAFFLSFKVKLITKIGLIFGQPGDKSPGYKLEALPG